MSASNANPANCNNVITVAATGPTGKRSSFSNYGSTVDIAAPGEAIYSTMNSGPTSPSTQTYGSYQGTSMATPHVSAVVALILSREPNLTSAQVLARLQGSVTSFGGGVCDSVSSFKTCGSGVLNGGLAVR
jgi:serine protease